MPERTLTKPDLGGGVSHPARYHRHLLELFAWIVAEDTLILDPFAGTGRIHELPNRTVGVELEAEWARLAPGTIVGDATALPFPDDVFDAVVTSPTYGNRLADHHQANDGSYRRSYTHDLGRDLHPNNSGALHWGAHYQAFHERAWHEAARVLKPGGRLVLNVKDHIRDHARQPVAGWHATTLARAGFTLLEVHELDTGGLRVGANTARLPEQVFVFTKDVSW